MKPFNFITLCMAIITLWCGRFWCDSHCNGGHCPANSGRPRTLLAAGGLQLFARYSEGLVPVELSPDATVKDLYERIAELIGVRADKFSVSFQGETLDDRNAEIADTGISSEAVVDVARELTPFEMLSHLFDSMDVVENPPGGNAESYPNQESFRNLFSSVKGGQEYSDEQLCELELLIKCDDQQRITWILFAQTRLTGILNIRYIPKSVTLFAIYGNALEAIVFTGISDDMELKNIQASNNKNLQLRIEGQENIAKLKKLEMVVIDREHKEKVQDPLRDKFKFS